MSQPDWAFRGRRSLSDSLVRQAFSAVGDFHDAYVERARRKADDIELLVRDPYFLSQRAYNCFEIEGAKIRLRLSAANPKEVLDLVSGAFDRDIYELSFDPKANTFKYSVESFYDIVILYQPSESSFEWCYEIGKA